MTDQEIREKYLVDIALVFKNLNEEWLKEELAALQEDPTLPFREAFEKEIYDGCILVKTESFNLIEWLYPQGYALFADMLGFFGQSEMTWTKPCIEARLVEGEARLIISVLLICND